MGEHDTWYTLLDPEFWARLNGHGPESFGIQEALGREWKALVFQDTHFTLIHVVAALIAAVFILVCAFSYLRSTQDKTEGVVPPAKWNLAAMTDGFVGAVFQMASDIMGEHQAKRYLPFIGTLALFIFCCNLQGLIPGLLPATDTLKTNLALAIMVFLLYNYVGIRENGMAYLGHFLGPKFDIGDFKIPLLAPLMLPIELASHIARPVSLSLRLMGNMLADHKVVGAVLMLVPWIVPVPFLLLGVLVTIIQTLVFTLLTMVYIGMAAEHQDH